ncbi:MAG TPA: SDR family NAD(P)-dependent oxidoreductase [Planctomycetota bacterium]|nr:SDR family NAD(P)-dependent oxidoreductase [Planctomycetota bacterium]
MDPFPLNLAGRRTWITGGTSGLGLAAADAFVRLGAPCTLLARDPARGAEAVHALSGPGRAEAAFRALDVGDAARCGAELADEIARRGAPRVVVHCAGALVREDLASATPESFAQVFAPSVNGAVHVLRSALPAMIAAGGGAVVLTSSYLATRGGSGGMPLYGAAKAALLGLMKSLAVRHGPDGVRVNAVLPAFIETPLNRDVFETAPDPAAKRRETAARFPLGRYGAPGDFASAAVFLASDAASWITGHGLVLDGGLTA